MSDKAPLVRRGFLDIDGGQVHFRTLESERPSDAPPLVMFHASPGSSKMLTPLMRRMSRTRRVFAFDTLGNGDSSAPEGEHPAIAVFAEAHIQALEALGVAEVDLYGAHTGGCIASEIAIRRPDLVRSMILDGMSLYSDAERDDMLRQYAPALSINADASHLLWIWHFVRDAYIFWPWYRRDAEHARGVGLPSPDTLHDKFVEVAKAARTYHLSYRAAIAYDKTARLPLVKTPTLLVCAKDDMLLSYFDQVAALLLHAERAVTPGFRPKSAGDETIGIMERFLDGLSSGGAPR